MHTLAVMLVCVLYIGKASMINVHYVRMKIILRMTIQSAAYNKDYWY